MENEFVEIKPRNMYFGVCITQIICIAAIIITVLIIKYFFPNNFSTIKSWCENNVFEQTKIATDITEETNSEV